MNRKSRGAFLKTFIGILDTYRARSISIGGVRKGEGRYFNATSRPSESTQLMHPNASLALPPPPPPPPFQPGPNVDYRRIFDYVSARYADSSLYSRINGSKWVLRGGRVVYGMP